MLRPIKAEAVVLETVWFEAAWFKVAHLGSLEAIPEYSGQMCRWRRSRRPPSGGQ